MVLGTCLLLLAVWQQADPQAEGIRALDKQDYPAAIAAFTRAVDADPNDYAARFHLALAQSLAGRAPEAIAGYRKALELKPGLYEAELNLGILLLGGKDAAGAVPLLESAASKKPKEFRPNFYLAEGLLEAGQPARAEVAYRSALESDPKSAGAELGLGRALAHQDRLGEGSAHFRKAAALDAVYRDALLELAELLEKSRQPVEAIALYQEFPENAGARERLGELLLEAARPAEAVPHLEYAVGRSPTAANRVALATAYLRAKQPEKALPLVAQALQESGDQPDLRMMYGRLLRDGKQYQAAAREFSRVAEKRPDSREAWSELAAMLNLLEDYPRALGALDRLEALGERGPALSYLRAILLDKLQQFKPALDSYEKFLAASEGKHPEEEFKARQRVRILKKEIGRR